MVKKGESQKTVNLLCLMRKDLKDPMEPVINRTYVLTIKYVIYIWSQIEEELSARSTHVLTNFQFISGYAARACAPTWPCSQAKTNVKDLCMDSQNKTHYWFMSMVVSERVYVSSLDNTRAIAKIIIWAKIISLVNKGNKKKSILTIDHLFGVHHVQNILTL